MTDIFEIQEDTVQFKGTLKVLESISLPGMLLLEVKVDNKISNDSAHAGIRLTLSQAKLLVGVLNSFIEYIGDR